MRALSVVALVVAVVALIVALDPGAGEPAVEAPGASDPVETDLATVVRTDLVQTETVEGQLRFPDAGPVVAQRPGTVTGLPEEGAVIEIFDVAYSIDGVDVVAFAGDRPAWRPFVDGMSDGPDVRQLEENLVTLGHGEDLEPDDEFDDATVAAVEAWQDAEGREVTGSIALGSIVFVPAPYRVGEVAVVEAAPVVPGTIVYPTSSLVQQVVIELDPRDLDLVSLGDAVTVVLPDDRRIDGEISEIGAVVRRTSPEPGAPEVIDVFVTIADTGIALERAPVDVEIERDRAASVLAVPVRALVSLSDGGYAVEVHDAGSTQLVGVTIGDFAEGLVEVEGAISEGDSVVVPVG